jgi:type IV pilus assembly protein PilA
MTRKQKGFSLIELLIVVAIILIIAAIAIPNLLRARIAANESSAVASIRTINTAELSYQIGNPTIGFTSLSVLGGVGAPCVVTAGTSACLVDNTLALGSKSGYLFVASPQIAAGTVALQVTVSAIPQSYNQSGVRSFCANEDAVIKAARNTSPAQVVTDATCVAPYSVLQ